MSPVVSPLCYSSCHRYVTRRATVMSPVVSPLFNPSCHRYLTRHATIMSPVVPLLCHLLCHRYVTRHATIMSPVVPLLCHTLCHRYVTRHATIMPPLLETVLPYVIPRIVPPDYARYAAHSSTPCNPSYSLMCQHLVILGWSLLFVFFVLGSVRVNLLLLFSVSEHWTTTVLC